MWLREGGFKVLLASRWNIPTGCSDAVSNFCNKIRTIGGNCKSWCRDHFFSIRFQKWNLLEQIGSFDKVEEIRELDISERSLKDHLVAGMFYSLKKLCGSRDLELDCFKKVMVVLPSFIGYLISIENPTLFPLLK